MEWDFSKNISNYKRFFKEGIFIDTGPLMLLFYGDYDSKNNTNFLTKEGYLLLHFEALRGFLQGCTSKPLRLIITPHVFTEFYKHVQKDFEKQFSTFFSGCVDRLKQIEEKNVSKDDLLTHRDFFKFEIGELSLFCLREPIRHYKFHVILHHDSKIDQQHQKDKNILTIHDIKDVYSWYLSNLNK